MAASNRNTEADTSQRTRVFISYKRNSEPDEPVALRVFDELRQHYDVFIDQEMAVGTDWGKRIEEELRLAHFVITFLSARSVNSEMVAAEISTAYHLSKEQGGQPAILPVRLDYREPFQYPLSAYLDHINWALWQCPEDTPRIIDELKRAISGGGLSITGLESKMGLIEIGESPALPQPKPSAQPVRLEMPEGTMDPEDHFYIERPSDSIALKAIERQGVTITIKAPRQMGKSSLLIRTIDRADRAGKRVAFLDFQLFDRTALADADIFFRQFCTWVTDSLEIEVNPEDNIEKYWDPALGNSQLCTRYMERYIFKQIDSPIVLAMDEVESIFEASFRTDFFSMLRSWHNKRATNRVWKRMDLALITSTEPYQLIENLNQSPFNVGEVIELIDLTSEQVSDLNQRHGSPLTAAEEQRLMALLNGHPYLIRRALYLIADNRISITDLFKCATDDRGPFGDHLRNHLFRLHDKEELIQGLRGVIKGNTLKDDLVFFRLRGAGLVRREGTTEVPRCQLYANYFREHLNV